MPDELTEDERLEAFIAELTADPRRAKAVAARWAKPMPANEAVAFLEQACRTLAAGNDTEAAAVCFSHIGVLDPAADEAGLGRLHARFLDFAPLAAIAPKDYRAYAKTLTAKTDPATAHTRFREVVCAAFDAGLVPYAAVFPDLRSLARGAGIKKAVEEAFLAERMLRTGAMAAASLKVWQGAVPALERLVAGDEDLLRLLVQNEPRDGSDTPEVAAQIRHLWFGLLAEAGAGRMLDAAWFAGPGALCQMGYLFQLVDQSDVPGWEPADGSVPDDGPQFSSAREFAPGDPGEERYNWPHWAGSSSAMQTFAEQLRGVDPETWAWHAEQMSGFVARFGYFMNVDYEKYLTDLWGGGEAMRALLCEQVDKWVADAASTGLHALDAALLRLSRLADGGYQGLDVSLAARISVTDPSIALMKTLRNGLPAELALPGPLGDPKNQLYSTMRVAMDGTRLTLTSGWGAHIFEPWQQQVNIPATILPNEASVTLWHDGTGLRVARRVGKRRHSFVLSGRDRDSRLTLDQNPAWPQAPTEAQVFFPGAREATRVSSGDGFAYVHAPEGTAAIRIPFGGLQNPRGKSRLVAPPAWWQYLEAVDVIGSKALRAVDETQARRLLAAGHHGPATAAQAVSEVLPDVTDPHLRDAVADAAVTAANCVVNATHLRRRLGLPQPESLPEFLDCRPGLPFYASSRTVAGSRLLDAVVRAAAEAEPAPDGALRLVRTIEVPTGGVGFWYEGNLVGGAALRLACPWSPAVERARRLETFQAMANTPQADGTRRWRYRDLDLERGFDGKLAGQLWRTPTSVLAVVNNGQSKKVLMLEYAPDGVFDPRYPDTWTAAKEYIRMPGWGSPDQIAAFLRLLDQAGKNPVSFSAAQATELAEKADISVGDAARACFGETTDNQPKDLRALYGTRDLSYRQIDGLREQLMPEDPADLWRTGLTVEKAAAWWNATRPDW